MQGIDLFCGAGGMSIGAAMSGVKVAHAVELDSKAAETFRRNHAHTTLHNQDIRTVSKADFTGLVKNMPTVVRRSTMSSVFHFQSNQSIKKEHQ